MSLRWSVVGSMLALGLAVAGPGVAASIAGPKPTITGFSPKRGESGATVAITGTHLAGANVSFGGTYSPTVRVNRTGTRLTAVVPVPDDVDEGITGPITVLTPRGAAQTTGTFTFVQARSVPYVFPRPRISGFTPARGRPGTTVTITGRALGGATAVTIGGVKTVYLVPAETKIVATVPPKAKSGAISVTTTGGTGTSAARFEVG